MQIAKEIVPDALAEQDAAINACLAEAYLLDVENAQPVQKIAAWGEARASGGDVLALLDLLERKRRQMLVEPLRRNATSIASGLKT